MLNWLNLLRKAKTWACSVENSYLTPNLMNNWHFNDFLGIFIMMGPLTLCAIAALFCANFIASEKRLAEKVAKAREEAAK